MGLEPTTIDFAEGRPEAVVAVMDRFAAAGDGSGWVNIRPRLTEEQDARIPARSGLAAWFSGRGPSVAMGTWMPAVTTGKPRPAQIGVEHGSGPNALARLADAGLALPAGWAKRQDHAKNGIVADLPSDADHGAVVAWLVRAVDLLTPEIHFGSGWTATVHHSV